MNGKQLKNSILQWAIQGKLVPQDPNDEPASVLLERIRAEKARLVKEGKIKKDKNESIIFRGDDNSHYEKFLATGEVKCIDDEIPFEIPAGWAWARLRDICVYIQRGKSPVYSEVKQYPVIAQKCNQWSGFSIEKAQFVAPKTVPKYSEERILQDKDLLWNSTGLGTLGRIAVYLSEKNPYGWAVADSHVTVIRLLKYMSESNFYYAFFSSPTVQSVIEEKAEGSTKQKELYVDTVKACLVPVPPIDEQKRIVAKIDEVINRLNSDINDRIKRSILQEAIQGKLVPQNPNDEPALLLLDRIREEKQRLLKEGKLKKKDITDSVIFRGDDNKYYERIDGNLLDISDVVPFDLPDSWVWARLSSVCNMFTGNSISEKDKSTYFTGVSGMQYIGTKDVRFDNSIDYKNGIAIPDIFLPNFKIAPSGSVLMCIEGGSAGRKVGQTDRDVCFGNKLCCFSSFGGYQSYLYYYIQSPSFVESFQKNKTGIIGGVSVNSLKNLLIAIPPIKEQVRIAQHVAETLLCL